MPDATREWLRSAPAALPFREVWDDLMQVAGSPSLIRVESDYSADTNGMFRVRVGSHEVDIYEADLAVLWDVFRDHGFLEKRLVKICLVPLRRMSGNCFKSCVRG